MVTIQSPFLPGKVAGTCYFAFLFSKLVFFLQSYFGANVLHPRTIIPVMRYDIPILIRNIFNLSAPGTMICRPPVNEFEDGQGMESFVKGFATIDNLALVNVEG